MAWLSPSYPVGAFSYSSGIEWAVEAGDIKDADSLRRWLAVVIGEGGGFCDAVFFVHAHRSLADTDDTALRTVAELAAAFAPSKERHLETTAQGAAFIEATTRGVALPRARSAGRGLDWASGLSGRGRRRGCGPRHRARAGAARLPARGRLPISFRPACASFRSARATASACSRRSSRWSRRRRARALATSLDDVGSAALRADLASMLHETQYTRLFRS